MIDPEVRKHNTLYRRGLGLAREWFIDQMKRKGYLVKKHDTGSDQVIVHKGAARVWVEFSLRLPTYYSSHKATGLGCKISRHKRSLVFWCKGPDYNKFNWKRILEVAIEEAEIQCQRLDNENRAERAKAENARLAEEELPAVTFLDLDGIWVSRTRQSDGNYDLRITGKVTLDQARRLVDILKETHENQTDPQPETSGQSEEQDQAQAQPV